MPASKPIRSFNFVPDGATLEVWTEGDGFTTIAKLRSTAGDQVDWIHTQLFRPEGASVKQTHTLKSPHFYRVLFATAFESDDDTEVEIHARVVLGEDEKVIRSHSWKLEGKQPDSEIVALRVGTADQAEDMD